MRECKSYRKGDIVCESGFVQRALCRGDWKCHACGKARNINLPSCITGEIPDHLMPIWERVQPVSAFGIEGDG